VNFDGLSNSSLESAIFPCNDQGGREVRSVFCVPEVNCKEDYIGETARPFGVRLKQHDNIRRASTTAVGDHLMDRGHTLDFSSSLIIARENGTFKRRIREAIEIHCQTPTMNRDSGYEHPSIYGDVLSRGFHHLKPRDKTSNTIT